MQHHTRRVVGRRPRALSLAVALVAAFALIAASAPAKGLPAHLLIKAKGVFGVS